jgi:hypothetical protein
VERQLGQEREEHEDGVKGKDRDGGKESENDAESGRAAKLFSSSVQADRPRTRHEGRQEVIGQRSTVKGKLIRSGFPGYLTSRLTLPTHPRFVSQLTSFGVHATVNPALKGSSAVLWIA